MFLTQKLAQEASFSDIQDRKVNVFFNGGVMGRFDLFGSSSSRKIVSQSDSPAVDNAEEFTAPTN